MVRKFEWRILDLRIVKMVVRRYQRVGVGDPELQRNKRVASFKVYAA